MDKVRFEDNPFSTGFLRRFWFYLSRVVLTDDLLRKLDSTVEQYEQGTGLNIRSYLIRRNELLSSFAVSKTERTSDLRIEEARHIRSLLDTDPERVVSIEAALGTNDQKAIKKEHDRLEFLNILKTYRYVSDHRLEPASLSPDLLGKVHVMLTADLDRFEGRLNEFEPYHPGERRCGDDIRVGSYTPVACENLDESLSELLSYGREAKTILDLNVFIAALYLLHPFRNGNKRVCRILEHGLLKGIDLNRVNIYSPLYYYHKQLDRFTGALFRTLEDRNFNHVVNVSREGMFYSQLYVLKLAIEEKRQRHLLAETNDRRRKVFSVFVKRKWTRFGEISKKLHKRDRVAVATLDSYLKAGVEAGLIEKIEKGRNTFYGIPADTREEETIIRDAISEGFAQGLDFIPGDFSVVISDPGESWRPRTNGR